MSNAGVVLAALLLDALLGEPRWLWSRVPHPAVLMGRAVGGLESCLNTGGARRVRGVLALAMLIVAALALGMVLARAGWVVQGIAAAMLLAQRSLSEHVRAVAAALRLSTGEGRRAVAHIVSRDVRAMDQSQVARAAIESAAENLSDGVVAPVFWFLLGGLPGLLVYKIVNTADSMVGYRTARFERFGWASARMDDILNLIPARLTGAMIATLARILRQWPAIARDARHHKSPNAGWPEAALARALGVALAGPRSYDGKMRDLAWVHGEARRDIGADEIDAADAMLWRVWRMVLIFVGLVACSGALPFFT